MLVVEKVRLGAGKGWELSPGQEAAKNSDRLLVGTIRAAPDGRRSQNAAVPDCIGAGADRRYSAIF